MLPTTDETPGKNEKKASPRTEQHKIKTLLALACAFATASCCACKTEVQVQYLELAFCSFTASGLEIQTLRFGIESDSFRGLQVMDQRLTKSTRV